MGSSRHQVTPSVYGYPKVPCGIVWRSSYHNLQRCVRTVPGRPSWDCLDMMSYQLAGMYRDCPRMSRHQVIPACRDVPGHPRTPFWDPLDWARLSAVYLHLTPIVSGRYIMSGQSWDVSNTCRQYWTTLPSWRHDSYYRRLQLEPRIWYFLRI